MQYNSIDEGYQVEVWFLMIRALKLKLIGQAHLTDFAMEDTSHSCCHSILQHTVTTDVQQATVSMGDNQSVEVECLFLLGSEALGCYVELTQDNKQMIRDRISRPNNSFIARGEIALGLALSCYEVYIYDWEVDNTTGTVPIPVEISYVNSTSVEHCRTTVSPPPTELPMSGVFRQAEFSTQLHPTYL